MIDDEQSTVTYKSTGYRYDSNGWSRAPIRESAASESPVDEAELMTLCTAITAIAAAVWLITGFLSL